MNTPDEAIGQALDLAKRGLAYDACERLWPLVRDPTSRDEAVFTLAYCFECANNLPTAAYLYGWVAERHPEFNVAARRLEKCRAALDARGVHEDFADTGHVDCGCGQFRYRAELGLCPYCGNTPGESAAVGAESESEALSSVESSRTRSDEVLQNVRRELERAWKAIQERFDEFQQREDLTGPAQHAQILTKEIAGRVRRFSETETAWNLRRAAERAREKTAEQLRAATERGDVQQARTRLEEWTREAADRIEELARSERVQSAGRNAFTVMERFVARLQGFIDRAKGTPPKQSESETDSREP